MATKSALVFGGSRGIGAAIVRALARDGFDVAFTYHASAKAAQDIAAGVAKATPDTRIACYPADICAPDAVATAFTLAEREFGQKPQCVIANAGINVPVAPVGQFDAANFRALVETCCAARYRPTSVFASLISLLLARSSASASGSQCTSRTSEGS